MLTLNGQIFFLSSKQQLPAQSTASDHRTPTAACKLTMDVSLLDRSSRTSLRVMKYDILLQLPIIQQQTARLAKQFIQSFKRSMKASRMEGKPLHQKINKFLLTYRNTIHLTTGQIPAMVFMGPNLRSRLNLLKPEIRKEVQEKQTALMDTKRNKTRTFKV